MTCFSFLKNLSLVVVIMASAFGTEPQTTRMKIQAQDGEIMEDFMLTLELPASLKEGPEDEYLKIVVPEAKKALKDHTGNFLEYKVNQQGESAPQILLLSVTSVRPTSCEQKIRVLAKLPNRQELPEDEHIISNYKDTSISYNLFNYALPDAALYGSAFPYTLKPIDVNGKIQTIPIEKMPFFDTVSAFGTIWYVFKMYEDNVHEIGTQQQQKIWKERALTTVYPFMTQKQYQDFYPGEKYEDNIGNAFYDFKEGKHLLCFFPVDKIGKRYTSQSFDILAHESGHNILNILRPDLWNEKAFHESFGDLTALFTLLTFHDIQDVVIKVTQSDLSKSSFLSIIGEKIANRDAAALTDLLLVPSCEEHDLSQRLTRAIYSALAEVFWLKKIAPTNLSLVENLFNLSRDLRRVFFKTTLEISPKNFTFAEFGRKMIQTCEKVEGLSYFSGYILLGFVKQGIDLHDSSWKICMPSSAGNHKGRCSTLEHQKNGELFSKQRPIKLIRKETYWYTPSFRPQKSSKHRAVFGKDDRIQVTDTTREPWIVHGQLEMIFRNEMFTGSGTLISPWHVLTAGHNLYDVKTKTDAQDIIFYPGKNGKKCAAQPAKGRKWEVLPEYKRGNKKHDMGIIELERAVGEEVGWNGLLVLSEDRIRRLLNNVSGYPGDKPEGSMWTDKGEIKEITDSLIHYLMDTNRGESGSALWTQLPQENFSSLTGYYNIGVHVRGEEKFNTATRLTPTNIRWLINFMEENNSTY